MSGQDEVGCLYPDGARQGRDRVWDFISIWLDHYFAVSIGLPPLPRPVLQGLGQVRCFDVVCAGEIGDGAGDFEDEVLGAGGELQLPDSGDARNSAKTSENGLARRILPLAVSLFIEQVNRVENNLGIAVR